MIKINNQNYLETKDIIKGGRYSIGVNDDTARRILHSGEIEALNVSNKYYFTLEAVKDYLRNKANSRIKAKAKRENFNF